MDNEYQEVSFDQYCDSCKYGDLSGWKDPCNGCLSEPTNLNSHKPVKWEEK